MKISEFFDNEFINYSVYDSYRSIGNYIDGLKPSSRKILYCAFNLKQKEKVSIFVSTVSKETEYLHGSVSLEGVLVGMAQDFAGSNNINLLLPEGSFGTRTIQDAAASRYIFTKKNTVTDKLFNDVDNNVLINQEFEGTNIEPRFYVPVLPMILVNGSEGIGNGFAQKILSRDPEVLKQYILNKLSGKKTPSHIIPYFKGFSGTVRHIENSSYEIIGTFERTNQTTITVTELPIGYDLQKYISILTRLEEDKVIFDYTDKSSDNTFLFELKVAREFVKKDDDWILNKLKLIRRVTENFTCIGENNQIVEFKNEIEILDAYIKIRQEYYQKRKDFQIQKLRDQLLQMGAKFYFIKNVLEDKIVLNKKSKSDIEKQIRSNKSFPFEKLEDLSFLLNMPIHSLSIETYEELKKAIDIKKEELTLIQNKDTNEMWIEEIKDLKGMK